MKGYQTSTPRMSVLFAAIALSALTIALSVILPAAMDSGEMRAALPAGTTAAGSAPIEAVMSPGHIEVVVLRDAESGPSQIAERSPRTQTAEVRDLGFISVQACSNYSKRKHRAGSA